MSPVIRLPSPCVVVLAGPSGSGKSMWAEANFEPGQIVASDQLRVLVGEGEHDQRASKDAFALLDQVLTARTRRRLTTVVDTLGFEADVRQRCRQLAAEAGMSCVAIAFDTPPALCRARNRARERRVPDHVLTGQLRQWVELRETLRDEGFDALHAPGRVELVPEAFTRSQGLGGAGYGLRFGLQVNAFGWPDGAAAIRPRLAAVARAAEDAGFESLWVMDHMRQIPQVGPAWADLLECFTTLGFLTASTERIRLGSLVAGITYRNVAQLGKMVATLDVLSSGRVTCGLGLGWFEQEHRAYGWAFPARSERYALLEDALRFLPIFWGAGSPAFEGRVLKVPEAMCYPRPIQAHVPLLVGGSGERRTLRLAARYADACNVFGEPDVVRHKIEVLRAHCRDADRDPEEVQVTHLTDVLVGWDRTEVDERVASRKPARMSAERFAARVHAGTVDDHVARFRAFASVGVQQAIVSLADLTGPEEVERFGAVIERFR